MAATARAEPTAPEMLRAVLVLVESGELTASSPEARRLVRRIEGAIAALEASGLAEI
jgi:hypothetical protein